MNSTKTPAIATGRAQRGRNATQVSFNDINRTHHVWTVI